ncbi:MAG: hypothetical protein CVV42_10205 [Candidatus Riflebacteria bacterium HGW-Riflebacteria-2]|jgi:serine phosphatase RsbU (regulator of sigma subunit)|nr:MAG: hypothetical protein CVV42_10205 [Candidatus Riflebacteria bacterium HGW-Riflebacteria-2]
MSERHERNIFSRYRALTWIGGLVCFVLVPVLLLNALVDNTLRLRSEKEQQMVFSEMDNRLNFLSQNVDIPFFLHKILKRQVDRAEAHAQPLQSLEQSIKELKKKYPGLFRFIVWDARGKTVDALTDEKSYRYIVSNLYGFFGEIAEHCRNEYPGFPELLPIVDKRINIFRAYLGRFLVPSHLRYPFQKGEHGRMILSEAPQRFPLFWFDARSDFTIFCAANPTEKHRHIGIQSAVDQINSDSDDIKTTFIDLRKLPVGERRSHFDQMILLELGKFENASLPHRQLKDHLVAFKLLDPYLRGCCSISRNRLQHGYPGQIKARLFARLGIIASLIIFVFYCYSLRLPQLNFSLITRIALLFIYVNGLPLLILGTIGHEYLQQLEGSLLHTTHRDHERLLEEIDAGYRKFQEVLAARTRNALASYSVDVRDRQPDINDVPFFQSIVKQLQAEEAYIYGRDGEVLLGYRRARKAQSQSIMKLFSAHMLRYMNRNPEGDSGPARGFGGASYLEMSKESLSRDGMSLFRSMLHVADHIEMLSFGTEKRMCFFSFFGDKSRRSFHSLLMLSWLHNQVQEAYAKHQAAELAAARNKDIRLVCMSQHSGNLVGSHKLADASIRPILQRGFNLQSARENALYYKGRRYIVTALAGRQLDNMSLAAIIPGDEIEVAVRNAQTQLMWLGLISLTIVSGVVLALSRQFIAPVRQLAEAVEQIGRRNFGFRNNIESADEFGDLGRVFNSTMAGMHELEIGKIVQATLLPEALYRSGRVEIFARSISMTKLGGDYFDYCKPAAGLTGVFMGDVAGHGIPAALIMAMAKAIVTIDQESLSDPSQLLTSLHDVLFKLKSDGFKRMMTCQYLVIDDQTGACRFANAGHCYPIIVSQSGSTSAFEEIVGSPVGISKRARYSNYDLAIKPGDTIILYSDGMLEARNSQNLEYGPERLLELTRQAWHQDIQQYYSNLYQANLAWSDKIEDDITIVLIRFSTEAPECR